MKRSLKTLAACATFTICMCATMIVSFAATDLKIDPVALVAYAQEAASSEDGVSVTGGELFIGLDTGSYTFADVAESLNDYGLQYEVADGANGSVYLIGGAVELGPNGTFEDPLSADAVYCYNVVGDGYQPVIVTIATKNAEEAAQVVIAGAGDAAQNGLPEIPEEVTDALNDIYTGITGVVPGIISDLDAEIPDVISDVVGDITDNYSDIIDDATKALDEGALDNAQDFIDTAINDIVGAIGDVIGDVAGPADDTEADTSLSDLLALLFS